MNTYGGGIQVPAWTSGDYDSLYILHVSYAGGTIHATFERDSEGLNGQPTTCPFDLHTPSARSPRRRLASVRHARQGIKTVDTKEPPCRTFTCPTSKSPPRFWSRRSSTLDEEHCPRSIGARRDQDSRDTAAVTTAGTVTSNARLSRDQCLPRRGRVATPPAVQ